MYIVTLRTDKPEAELGLFDDDQQLTYQSWSAHRELAETIHLKLKELLEENHLGWQDVQAIAVFKGPGSFTGLRIGVAVANALADGLRIPLVGTSGNNWLRDGLRALLAGQDHKIIVPEYGALPHITPQKH